MFQQKQFKKTAWIVLILFLMIFSSFFLSSVFADDDNDHHGDREENEQSEYSIDKHDGNEHEGQDEGWLPVSTLFELLNAPYVQYLRNYSSKVIFMSNTGFSIPAK
ncbi:MAG: hypothetical protein WDZ91_09885 [Paenibacillaceae bacterium]